MLLPWEKFTITTSLTPAQVRHKLSEVVEPVRGFRSYWHRSQKPYQGQIGEHSFRISRILNYRNSFVPIVTGQIRPHGTGSEIAVSMKMHEVVIIFIILWLSTVGHIGLLFLIATLSEVLNGGKFEPAALVPVGMFVFVCLMCVIGFKPQANSSKQFLIELLTV